MNAPWILVSALTIAMCLPQQPGKPGAEPSHPTIIFEKPLSSSKKLIVTCEEVPLVLTPKQAAEREKLMRTMPGAVHSVHLYAYSYITVTKGGLRKVLWTEHVPTFGGDTPGKADDMSMSIGVLDVALQGNVLLVLYQQNRGTGVNIVRLNAGRGAARSLPGSRQTQGTGGGDAVQSPLGPRRLLEASGPLDIVAGGRILGPTANGEVAVQLSHGVKQQDGSTRITVYHLTYDAEGRELWMPDPSNVYANGERPGIQGLNRQP